jgi:hypothetical protein
MILFHWKVICWTCIVVSRVNLSLGDSNESDVQITIFNLFKLYVLWTQEESWVKREKCMSGNVMGENHWVLSG